jgi:hypothetical protein
LAPFQHLARDRHAFGFQLFQHRLVGGILARLALLAALQAHLVEQDLAQLLGAADGEGLASQLVDLASSAAMASANCWTGPPAFAIHLDA